MFKSLLACCLAALVCLPAQAVETEVVDAVSASLIETHGEAHADRIAEGVRQAAALWREADGDDEAFSDFAAAEWLPPGDDRDRLFVKLEKAFESIDGYFLSMSRDLRLGTDLEIGPLDPIDRKLAGMDLSAHLEDDLYGSKLAFVVLLNFPVETLDTKEREGAEWSRRQWAEARMGDRFRSRVPGEVTAELSKVMADADTYISTYNIHMHGVVDDEGESLFPEDLKLILHWGLRDELKAQYTNPDGLPRQRAIKAIFDRIVRQEIPQAVIDTERKWNPHTNTIDGRVPGPREADTRYHHWLATSKAMALANPYVPSAPTFLERRFDHGREMSRERVKEILISVLAAPEAKEVAKMVAENLGRPLEPFDIWYPGFAPRGEVDQNKLDEMTTSRYPDADAFAADIPRILEVFDFSPEAIALMGDHIVVEPSRGAGHAMGAQRRADNAHLRTRIGEAGMDYKGYNIAVHELGHNVEQVFSLTTIDHTELEGVPSTAFTEALAFTFQHRDLELLGEASGSSEAHHLAALDGFWSTREIGGVALVDILVWEWLEAHPEASPAEMRTAVLEIAASVWNDYFAEYFGVSDEHLLCVYSHMVDGALYTPAYPIGHLIAFQLERFFAESDAGFGIEFERVCKQGRLTPDLWMQGAVGTPVSAGPLLEATREALAAMR